MTIRSFLDLGVSSAVVDTLAGRGIDAPFEIQRLVLPDALEGKDVLTPPNSPSEGVRVAMIVHDGAPIELMQFS